METDNSTIGGAEHIVYLNDASGTTEACFCVRGKNHPLHLTDVPVSIIAAPTGTELLEQRLATGPIATVDVDAQGLSAEEDETIMESDHADEPEAEVGTTYVPSYQESPSADVLEQAEADGVTELTSEEFLAEVGTDPALWSAAYLLNFEERLASEEEVIAWFANAIEAGRKLGLEEGHAAGYQDGYKVGNTDRKNRNGA